jgi:hypothetical protein
MERMGMGMEVEGLRASLEEVWMGTEREMSTQQRRKGASMGAYIGPSPSPSSLSSAGGASRPVRYHGDGEARVLALVSCSRPSPRRSRWRRGGACTSSLATTLRVRKRA